MLNIRLKSADVAMKKKKIITSIIIENVHNKTTIKSYTENDKFTEDVEKVAVRPRL